MNWRETQDNRCERMQTAINERFDRGDMDQIGDTLADHLSQCAQCRRHLQRVEDLQQGIRSLPPVPFPTAALEALFFETVDTASAPVWQRSWRRWGRSLAAAAVLALSVTVSWSAWRSHLSAQQKRVDEAVLQTRYVLAVTAGAFRRAESVAVDDLYGEHLYPALKRFNVNWSSKPFVYFR